MAVKKLGDRDGRDVWERLAGIKIYDSTVHGVIGDVRCTLRNGDRRGWQRCNRGRIGEHKVTRVWEFGTVRLKCH
jgi:hypothetical protein